MMTLPQSDNERQREQHAITPRKQAPVVQVSGDELFVPASHVLIIDRQVSHPAFRLWCILHRLWFLHEPPTVELLQELMGTTAGNKAPQQAKTWQPATRRSVERWLKELEQAGWLIWVRREEATRRYHLRTSARSATDSAVLHELRALLNSGKTTLAQVQALLNTSPDLAIDTTGESHDPIPGSHQDAGTGSEPPGDATPGSHNGAEANHDAITESHDATPGSHHTTAESHDATPGSHHTTTESHDATPGSHARLTEGVLMRQNETPNSEIHQNQIQRDPTPPPTALREPGGDGGGSTDTERFLLREGFSVRAAGEFRDLDLGAVQAELQRRQGMGQGIGAIVTTWRVEPPERHVPPASSPDTNTAYRAKEEALALAPSDATELELQYLALDIEEGATPETALANHRNRRASALVGGAP